MVRDSPGRSWPTSNSSSPPARWETFSGRKPSSTTPVAAPLPGLLTVIVSWVSRPISTGRVSDAVICSAGLVARERIVASARKLTLAMLPISPSCWGMTSIITRAWPPGSSVPRAQMSSPSSGTAVAAGGSALAGGTVATRAVPNGTASRSVTSWAVAPPTLRTRIS
jgi:hypothetical protein